MQWSPSLKWQRLLFPFSNLFIVFYTFLLYSSRVYSSLEVGLQIVFFFWCDAILLKMVYAIYPYTIDVAFKAISNFLILVWMHSANRQKNWNIYFRGGMGKHTDPCGSTSPQSSLAAVLKSSLIMVWEANAAHVKTAILKQEIEGMYKETQYSHNIYSTSLLCQCPRWSWNDRQGKRTISLPLLLNK